MAKKPKKEVISIEKNTLISILVGIGIFLIATFFIVGVFFPKHQTTLISGTIQYSGLSPSKTAPVDPDSKIVLSARIYGSTQDPQPFSEVPVVDGQNWVFETAQPGNTYEITGTLYIDGIEIKTSQHIVATAPASNETIEIKVSLQDLPEEMISYLEKHPDTLADAELSGKIDLSGYIPENSTVQILRSVIGEDDIPPTVITSVEAIDGASWSYHDAKQGVDYLIWGVLIDASGKTISSSIKERTIAPDANIQIRILSAINPLISAPSQPSSPSPTINPSRASISGWIDLNGPIAPNSTVLILQRKPGETEFIPVTRIPAKDGQYWEWKNAVHGREYEMQASLQVNENNISTSQLIRLIAPAKAETFRINTGINISPPTQKPELDTCIQDGNQWYATLRYPKIANAGMYHTKVGSQAGYGEVWDAKENTGENRDDARIKVKVNNNATYHTQYAYAYCSDCTENNNYSSFSPTLEFKCGDQTVPKYTGYTCDESACVLTTNNTHSYALNTNGLKECQAVCGQWGTRTSDLTNVNRAL